MSRPRKNTKEGKRASEKWRKTMIEKYGSITNKMKEVGRIGGKNGKGPDYRGGFASDHEKARIAGALGGQKSRRTGKYTKKLDENKEVIKQTMESRTTLKELAEILEVPYSSLIHYTKTHLNK